MVADRAYLHLKWMQELTNNGTFFVIRGKENLKLNLVERSLDKSSPKNADIQYDREGHLELPGSKEKYPNKIRMVQIWDEEQQMHLELLTNNFTRTAATISELYKRRWSVEQFFSEIKSHLKIRSFVGTSLNAVLIQIWITLITMLLLKTLKKEAKFKWHLSNLVSFIRLNLFVKIDLKRWLDKLFPDDQEIKNLNLQLILF